MTDQEARDEREDRRSLSRVEIALPTLGDARGYYTLGPEAVDAVFAWMHATGYRKNPEPEATEIEARAALEEAIALWDDARRHGKRGGREANAIYEAMDAYRAAILAAGYRKLPEPEWEYGHEVRLAENGAVLHSLEWGSREQAEQVVQEGNEANADDPPHSRLDYSLVKRTPGIEAGPWLPVGEVQ